MSFLEKIFSLFLSLAPAAPDRGEVEAFASRMLILAGRKAADPVRFAQRTLNASLHHRQKLHQLIEGFQREGIDILPLDRNRSGYGFTLEREEEGGVLRAGFALVPGFTEELALRVREERDRVGEFPTLAEFLLRLADLRFPRPALLRLAKALYGGEAHPSRSAVDRSARATARRHVAAGKVDRAGRPSGWNERKGRKGRRTRKNAQIALPLDVDAPAAS